MNRLACICLAVLMSVGIIGCASRTPTPVAQQVMELATATPYPTYTPQPTETPTHTPRPTETPTVMPTDTLVPTPTATETPRPTKTVRPTTTPTRRPTATRLPSVGDTVRCNGMWEITVETPPSFAKALNVLDTAGYLTFSSSELAKGTWMLVLFELTNLEDETDSLSSWGDELSVQATLKEHIVSFPPSSWSTSRSQRESGISDWNDAVPPGISITAIAIFDVNPDATDWMLVVEPEIGLTKACRTEILLDYSNPAISEGAPVVVVGQPINLRQGPGTGYPIVGKGATSQRFEIVGRNTDSSWWNVCCVKGERAWVANSIVEVVGDLEAVALVMDIPSPPPTSPPPATATPLPRIVPTGQEFQVSIWGLKLYGVKKTKVVYWFGSAEVAKGMWLIPFVEFRNLGTGTAEPSHNLDFYLMDAAGRTFDYDPFGDAVLGAAWQFQAGHLYDDINPGLNLGIALPFDVPGDLGDVWLRVEQDRNFVLYLGDMSQMPEHK